MKQILCIQLSYLFRCWNVSYFSCLQSFCITLSFAFMGLVASSLFAKGISDIIDALKSFGCDYNLAGFQFATVR